MTNHAFDETDYPDAAEIRHLPPGMRRAVVIGQSGNARHEQILNVYRDRARAGLPPPTVRELCLETGLRSTSTVQGHLNELVRRGDLVEHVTISVGWCGRTTRRLADQRAAAGLVARAPRRGGKHSAVRGVWEAMSMAPTGTVVTIDAYAVSPSGIVHATSARRYRRCGNTAASYLTLCGITTGDEGLSSGWRWPMVAPGVIEVTCEMCRWVAEHQSVAGSADGR
jgi:LexA DNA binding domain